MAFRMTSRNKMLIPDRSYFIYEIFYMTKINRIFYISSLAEESSEESSRRTLTSRIKAAALAVDCLALLIAHFTGRAGRVEALPSMSSRATCSHPLR